MSKRNLRTPLTKLTILVISVASCVLLVWYFTRDNKQLYFLSYSVAGNISALYRTSKKHPTTVAAVPSPKPRPDFDLMGLHDMEMPDLTEHSDDASLYPDPSDPWNDRIIRQLSYVPRVKPTSLKKVLIPQIREPLIKTMGRKPFLDMKCKVSECVLTNNISDVLNVDVVLIEEFSNSPPAMLKTLFNNKRRPDQVWAFVMGESSQQAQNVYGNREFNWTITYSPSSLINGLYASTLYPITAGVTTLPQTKNFAAGKTGKVAWFASNCDSGYTPNKREDYVRELAKYIQVDIFGKCSKTKKRYCAKYLDDCMVKTLSNYKFYLAFENSNCETYITEKYFNTALGNEILPIVMGALPAYYKRISPPRSHIHVEEFAAPKHLAAYLNELDKNDTLYNSYFQWKGAWRGIPRVGWLCRVCALLHAPRRSTVSSFVKWRASDRCRHPTFLPDRV